MSTKIEQKKKSFLINSLHSDIIHDKDVYFMNCALEFAKKAYLLGEVPVGAILVKDDQIIARGYNFRENGKNALRHAELDVIRSGCNRLKSWRLSGCELYVTVEPCIMCAGAIVNARITRVIFGAGDNRMGAFGSLLNLNSYPLNHKVKLTKGVCEAECRQLMREFFENKRK